MHTQVLRIKKLKGRSILLVAAKHNHREIAAERGADSHIDADRTCLNRVLRGPVDAAGVVELAHSLRNEAGLQKLRKDAVQGLEMIFSLPVDFTVDRESFFSDAIQWVQHYFRAPILSAVVHYDESAPHMHVIVLPLVDGRMVGSSLMGNQRVLQAIQADFHGRVGVAYGLRRKTPVKAFNASVRRKAAMGALDSIKADHGLLKKPQVMQALYDAIAKDPGPLTLALGLEMPAPNRNKRTFAGIMTKPCKPSKHIGFD